MTLFTDVSIYFIYKNLQLVKINTTILTYFSIIMQTKILVIGICIFICVRSFAQSKKLSYTHQDSLKGTITQERSWWDVTNYNLNVRFNLLDSSLTGNNQISYSVLKPYFIMQIDLMQPMQIDSILQDGSMLNWRRDGNTFFVNVSKNVSPSDKKSLTVYFHGKPIVAKSPPWDGGVVWTKDKKNNPWVSIACQGMAAGVWFPNKDHMYDEVDSASISITVPKTVLAVSNGRMRNVSLFDSNHLTFNWVVKNPINNYNIIPYIGQYVNFKDTLNGKQGVLDLDYWVLSSNYERGKNHFKQVKPMLRCFEDWFGKYPFYEDAYKLVEAPYLGMEHQSAIAYGNDFQNGYMGRDLSNTGRGNDWDFIIVHESGHEWFGNNISAKDVADNWIHESFTAYAENLYVEYLHGKKAGAEYVIGTRKLIMNDKPIIADYNVNAGGSIDLYYKGSNMLHTIRQIVSNDSLWKELMRSLNKTFWHQTVTTAQIEKHMSNFLKIDLQKVFDQYLRTTQIPVLEYKFKKGKVNYRWSNCFKGFNMQVKVVSGNETLMLKPTTSWQSRVLSANELMVDENYFVLLKKVAK